MGSMFDNVDTSKMVSAIDKLEYRMSTLGQFTGRIVQNVADDIYSVIKKALGGIEKVVTYAESGIIQGGYTRASTGGSATAARAMASNWRSPWLKLPPSPLSTVW